VVGGQNRTTSGSPSTELTGQWCGSTFSQAAAFRSSSSRTSTKRWETEKGILDFCPPSVS
ncbi:hypothetical protein HPP92_014530, partial [Vanilla planifolia]